MKNGSLRKLVFLATVFTLATSAHAAPILQLQSNNFVQILLASPVGQTFTAEDAAISSIGFFVDDINSSSAPSDRDLSVALYAGDSGPIGPVLQTSTVSGINAGWVDFDFTGVALAVGAKYSAILMNNTQRWGLRTNQHTFGGGGGPIPGRIDYTGGDFIDMGNINPLYDATFRVLPVSSVPEPASILLVGLGLLVSRLNRR